MGVQHGNVANCIDCRWALLAGVDYTLSCDICLHEDPDYFLKDIDTIFATENDTPDEEEYWDEYDNDDDSEEWGQDFYEDPEDAECWESRCKHYEKPIEDYN